MRRLTEECYTRTRALLTEKKDLVEKLGDRLLAKETISLPDIVDTIGARPFPMKETLKEYMQELRIREEEDAATAKEAEDGAETKEADKKEEDEEEGLTEQEEEEERREKEENKKKDEN